MAAGIGQDGAGGRRRQWLILALILGVLGVGASLYSINHHLQVKASGQTDAACNINATFSCDAVALSKYSEIAGIPLGVVGLGYFLAVIVLIGIGLAGTKSAKEHIQSYAALVVIGVLTSIGLGLLSFLKLSALCPSCIAIYSLTLLQLILLLVYRREIPPGISISGLSSGGATAAIAVAVVIVGFSLIGPKKSADTTAQQSEGADGQDASNMPQLATQTQDIPIAKTAYAGLGEDYRKGSDSAGVVIVEFADFQCPACQHVSSALRDLHKEFGDKVSVVFRNYPLDKSCNSAMQGKMHEFACDAAILARCAGQYGKFWDYHDMVYDNQASISAANLKKWGAQVGLSTEQMDSCLASPDIVAKIKDDIKLGGTLGIDSTPTLFINGRKVVGGRGLNDLRRVIEEAM